MEYSGRRLRYVIMQPARRNFPMHDDDHSPHAEGGIDRRRLLHCSAWAGTGVVWALAGGVPKAFALDSYGSSTKALSGFHFLQISDTHIGFNKAANPDTSATLQAAIAKINGLSVKPGLILHTGDITHLSKPEQFDLADQYLKTLPAPIRYVPGEHDVADEGAGKEFMDRFGKGTKGQGWYSFDDHGVHFIALINVMNFQPGSQPSLGADQLMWLKDDLRALRKSTPIVVYSHVPLWTVYEPWGWGTLDGPIALKMLAPFGSVTVLNGHIHQIVQKVEGHMTFHSARSTAYPQPVAGTADAPGPMTVPAEQLRSYLGITTVDGRAGHHDLALTDYTLADS